MRAARTLAGAVPLTLPLVVLTALLVVFLLVSAFERVPMEVAAVGLVVALAVTGILDPEAALSGFSNPVVVAIAGLYVINAAVERSGAITWLGGRLAGVAQRNPQAALALLLCVGGGASMFVSNVATVALLAPAVLAASRSARFSPSRFLMPLAFASLVGGMATLIGATGNLIVQGMAMDAGVRPFGFFEFALVGLPLLAVTLTYLLTVGWRLVPERRPETDAVARSLRDFLVEVSVPEGSELAGRSLAEARLSERLGLTLLSFRRGEEHTVAPGPETTLMKGDRLIVEGGAKELAAAVADGQVATPHRTGIDAAELESDGVSLHEVLVPPRSGLVGRTARESGLRQRWGVTLLAILRGAAPIRRSAGRIRVRPGDELLVQGPPSRVRALEDEEHVIVLSQVRKEELRPARLVLPLGVLAGVVGLAATGVVSLAIAVLLGVTILLVSPGLRVDEATAAIDLRVVVVVACVLPLGEAFEAAGAAGPASVLLGALDGVGGPWLVLTALFVATSLLAQVVQKAAIAVAVPVALAAAQVTGSDPAPFLMAVAVAGSCAFLTPLAHPVNLIVYAPGQYRFTDFVRVGLPLQVVVTVAAVLLIPLIWPFGGP